MMINPAAEQPVVSPSLSAAFVAEFEKLQGPLLGKGGIQDLNAGVYRALNGKVDNNIENEFKKFISSDQAKLLTPEQQITKFSEILAEKLWKHISQVDKFVALGSKRIPLQELNGDQLKDGISIAVGRKLEEFRARHMGDPSKPNYVMPSRDGMPLGSAITAHINSYLGVAIPEDLEEIFGGDSEVNVVTPISPVEKELQQKYAGIFESELGISPEQALDLAATLAAGPLSDPKLFSDKAALEAKLKESIDAFLYNNTRTGGAKDPTDAERISETLAEEYSLRTVGGGLISKPVEDFSATALTTAQELDPAMGPRTYASAAVETYQAILSEIEANGQKPTLDQLAVLQDEISRRFERIAEVSGIPVVPGAAAEHLKRYDSLLSQLSTEEGIDLHAIELLGGDVSQMQEVQYQNMRAFIESQIKDADGKIDPAKVQAYASAVMDHELVEEFIASPAPDTEQARGDAMKELLLYIGGEDGISGSILNQNLRQRPGVTAEDNKLLDKAYSLYLLQQRGGETYDKVRNTLIDSDNKPILEAQEAIQVMLDNMTIQEIAALKAELEAFVTRTAPA